MLWKASAEYVCRAEWITKQLPSFQSCNLQTQTSLTNGPWLRAGG